MLITTKIKILVSKNNHILLSIFFKISNKFTSYIKKILILIIFFKISSKYLLTVEIIVKMSPIVKVEMSPKKYDKIISIIINHKKIYE